MANPTTGGPVTNILRHVNAVMTSHTPTSLVLGGMYLILVLRIIQEPGYSRFRKQMALMCFSNLLFYPNLLLLYLLLYLDVTMWQMVRRIRLYKTFAFFGLLLGRHLVKMLLVEQTFWGGVLALVDVMFLMSIWQMKEHRRMLRNDWTPLNVEELDQLDDICPICFEDMDEDGIKLNCNHTFHLTCVETWWERNEECPVCRRTLAEMRRRR